MMSLRNLVLGGFAIVAAAAFTAPANAVVILDDSGTITVVGDVGTSIDDWFFSLAETTWVDINVIQTGLVCPDTCFDDPAINLFVDDEDLTQDDWRAWDDESGVALFDSFIQIELAAGDYVVRVSDFAFGDASGTKTVIIAATNTQCGGCTGFDYDILIEGTVHGVPEPGTLALLGAALAGLGLFYRRRKVIH